MITWIVPTVTGREAGLERSLKPLDGRTDVDVLELTDRPTCGQAWVEGARMAAGDYVYFAADDIEPHDGFCEAMVETVDQDKHPAALVLFPNGAKQSCGGAGGDVCRGNCRDWQFVEWSPTPFIKRDWWELIEPHAEMLAKLHYSSDCLISAILASEGIPSVFRDKAVITHYDDPVGRLWTAGQDGSDFHAYRLAHGL